MAEYLLFLYYGSADCTTREQLIAIKAFLKALDIPFKKESEIPNTDTIAAMEELKAGKGKKFKSVEALFKLIS